MAIKKVYVGDHDGPLWEAAQRVADRRDISLSRLVREALEAHLPQALNEPNPAERWADFAATDAA